MAAPTRPKARRRRRDVVVIGASAGGVSALLALVKTLPADFPAPVFVVQHLTPDSPSILPQLLSSVSVLRVKHPQNGEVMKPGVIYVAPPDHHLLLEDNHVLVARGPKENRFRPSIDALFRSAAYTYGPRVIGVVLTGYLDDGTSGLWSVQRMGGLTVVQDPRDAEQPSMPTNALEFVTADYLVPLAELGALLVRLTTELAPAKPKLPADQLDLLRIELTIAKQGGGFELGIIDRGKLTPFTCPDCHGALTQLIEGKLIRYRCHTGHAYTVSATLLRAGRLDTVYCNFVYQPLLDAQGDSSGITLMATDVSEQVRARQQLEALGQELSMAYATLQWPTWTRSWPTRR